ncbi:chromate reductase [Tistlia consotensis]|uniref:Chromate reductase n=1 Tax=Tistlia consotensis USBA 355 TaxID=560819 RepID=A0A1Y6BB16_9PROT|nr:NAD(P)H-dependent oxidoreductase [Tistlia consotensis]SMF02216.1 chromate reductase [Tistlia consotensis USBA 355]SNS26484.1 chromate reductase [Tistlia consotensis]
MTETYRLLAVSGSLRRDSYNTIVARSLAEKAPSGVSIEVLTLNELPVYNADDDGEAAPAAAKALRGKIAAADGLIVVSPEYNYGIPGAVKNALDWASRPGFNSVLKDKPSLIMTVSQGATGGARAHAQIRETLAACLSRVVVRPQVTIAQVAGKVENGKLVDQAVVDFALAAIADLCREVRRMRAEVS